MLEEISAAIGAIGARADFAVEQSLPADLLELRVRGVGRVAVPVTEGVAAKLIAAARPAPFGVRDQTRHDERVRSTWEIPADRVAVGAAFDRALAPKLATIGRRLGLAGGGALRPVLDKLLVYGPGQFFAPHQDSERGDGMLATLVVVLPSRRHEGVAVGTALARHERGAQLHGVSGAEAEVAVGLEQSLRLVPDRLERHDLVPAACQAVETELRAPKGRSLQLPHAPEPLE